MEETLKMSSWVNSGTQSTPVPFLMSTFTHEEIIHSRILMFYKKGINHPFDSVRFLFRNSVFKSNSLLTTKITLICCKLGINLDTAENSSTLKLKNVCETAIIDKSLGA